jgi:hypothetical protein
MLILLIPDKGDKMETDILEAEDPKKLYTANQKIKVFGPAMLPPLKEDSEITPSTEVMEPTPPQSSDEKAAEGKRKRNRRRIEQRNRKVTVAYDYSLRYFR